MQQEDKGIQEGEHHKDPQLSGVEFEEVYPEWPEDRGQGQVPPRAQYATVDTS
jgi:hypothetical protein